MEVKSIRIPDGPFEFYYLPLNRTPWVQEIGYKFHGSRLDPNVYRSLLEHGRRAKARAIEEAKRIHRESLQGKLPLGTA